MVKRISPGIVLLFVLILAACRQTEPLPTLAPRAAPVTDLSSVTATLPLPATSTPSTPTATFTPSATPVVATPSPTPLTGTGVNITTPSEGSEFVLGTQMTVGGLAGIGASQALSLTLVSATGRTLAQTLPEVNEFPGWQATLAIPDSVSGSAEIRALLLEADGSVLASDTMPVMLQTDRGQTEPYLHLFRPLQGEQVVAGYNVFFDGLVQDPVDSLVTISLWNDDCQNRLARQSFSLRGSGYWQGFVVVPDNVSGQLCAVAHFGEPGDEAWREAQVQVEVLAPTDERATKVLIGNPPPDSVLTPGKSLLFYGTAYNAPDREVLVSIMLENGRLLTESVAGVDIFGYWEVELFIPADAEGPALIEATLGQRDSDEFVRSSIPVNISSDT